MVGQRQAAAGTHLAVPPLEQRETVTRNYSVYLKKLNDDLDSDGDAIRQNRDFAVFRFRFLREGNLHHLRRLNHETSAV